MKKALVFILIMSGLTISAQELYKPLKGDFTAEMQLSLFSFNAKIDVDNETIDYSSGPLSMQGLHFRYFLSDKLALRTTLGFSFDNNNAEIDLDDTKESYSIKYDITGISTQKTEYSTFSAALGVEWHFGDWERMSLYVGGELFYGQTKTKSSIDQKSTALYYSKNWPSEDWVHDRTIGNEISIESINCIRSYHCDSYGCREKFLQNAPMFFGGNLLFGMDFYIYKGLYMGAEFGFGYTYKKMLNGSYKSNITTTMTPSGSGSPEIEKDELDKKLEDKITSSNFNIRYNPMIRIGWRF